MSIFSRLWPGPCRLATVQIPYVISTWQQWHRVSAVEYCSASSPLQQSIHVGMFLILPHARTTHLARDHGPFQLYRVASAQTSEGGNRVRPCSGCHVYDGFRSRSREHDGWFALAMGSTLNPREWAVDPFCLFLKYRQQITLLTTAGHPEFPREKPVR